MSMRQAGSGWIVRHEFRARAATIEEAHRIDRLASSAIAKAQARIRDGARPCPTISEALDDFLREQAAIDGNARETLSAYRRRLERFAQAFRNPIDQVSRRDLVRWISRRLRERGNRRQHNRGAAVSRDTVNQDLKALRRFAVWVMQNCDAEDLAVLEVPLLRIRGALPGGRHTPRALAPEAMGQALAAIRAAAPHLEIVLRAMILTGARPGALFGLRWGQVHKANGKPGLVNFQGLKGAPDSGLELAPGSRQAALFAEAWDMSWRMRRRRPRASDFVFQSKRGRSRARPGGWTTSTYDNALRLVADRIGLEGFVAYLARHSAMTWLQSRKVASAAIQQYAKHARISTQEAYSHRTGKDALPALLEVGEMLPGDSGTPAEKSTHSAMVRQWQGNISGHG